MKLTLFVVLFSAIQIFANGVYSQNTRFTLTKENATIENVLNTIENQSEFYFLYNGKLVDVTQEVSIKVENQNLEQTLNKLFMHTNISYKVYDRQVVLSPAEGINNSQQQKSVSGKVTDSAGVSLPGVSVVIKGTTTGVITDMDGKYTLAKVPENATLQFSFVGMKKLEVVVENKTTINIVLEEETVGIDEVVAIGYGTVKRSDLTGSISSVNKDKFTLGNTVSADKLIQGKVAGVEIIAPSGEPGSAPRFRIRGGTSITASNDPLFIIDGVVMGLLGESSAGLDNKGTSPKNPLASINPSDIESIDIMKDASSTAIYGAQGANGVVIITTKKGKNGADQVNYTSSVSIGSIAKRLDILSASEFKNTIERWNATATNSDKITNYDLGASTDFQDAILQTAISQNHSLSYGGGSDTRNYRVSIGYSNENGIIKNSDMKRFTARVRLTQKALNNKLELGFDMNTSMDEYSNIYSPAVGFSGGRTPNLFGAMLKMNPTTPIKNPDGTYYDFLNADDIFNPVAMVNLLDDKTKGKSTQGTFTSNLEVFKGLKYTLIASLRNYDNSRNIYWPSTSPFGSKVGGSADKSDQSGVRESLETYLNYTKDLTPNQFLGLMAGYSYTKNTWEGMSQSRTGFLNDFIEYNSMQVGTGTPSVSSYKGVGNNVSFYGRVNYNLYHKYLFTATVRRDGSSKFGANNKWATFPSVAFAWKMSDEMFIKKIRLINNLKMRLSYGVSGSEAVSPLQSLASYSIQSQKVNMGGGTIVPALKLTRVPSPDLKWEETQSLNIGLDFGLFEGRLSGAFDYYSKKTNDLLLSYDVPKPAPVNTITANVGEVTNKGIELNLTGIIYENNDLKISVSGTLAKNRNNVVSLSNSSYKRDVLNIGTISGQGNSGSQPQVIKTGMPMYTFFMLDYAGLNKNGMETFYAHDKKGNLTYDANKKPVTTTTPSDTSRVYCGSALPNINYSFSVNANYKNFDLAIFFRGSQGAKVFNNTRLEASTPGRIKSGRNVFDDGSLAEGESLNSNARFVSNRFLENASFLKLDNVSLGYTFKFNQKKYIDKVKAYISGQNLITFTKYKGYDPELVSRASASNGVPQNGIDFNTYPVARTFTCGVSIDF